MRSISVFTFSDLRWMLQVYIELTLNLNILVKAAVSFHASVGYWQIIDLDLRMIQFCWIQYSLLAFAFQSPHK